MVSLQVITKKDEIIKLKQMSLKNSEIARLLNVSRQYVSHTYKKSQGVKGRAKSAGHNEFVTTGAASRILGVSEATIRRWSDQQKIPSFRIDIGRRDRRFRLSDLKQLKIENILSSKRTL